MSIYTTSANDTMITNGTCHLSPQARALSTVISAAAGLAITSITSGSDTVFHIAWVCFLGSLRIIITGVWLAYEALRLQPAAGGDQFYDFYDTVPGVKYITSDARDFNTPFFRGRSGWEDEDGVTFFGWLGWVWAAVYEPVMNTLWLVANWHTASGALKFARAISVGISALPLTMDTRARYGKSLEVHLGKPFRWLFTLVSAAACLYLGLLAVLLLGLALADWDAAVWKPVLVAIGYTLAMLFWTNLSFSLHGPHDEVVKNNMSSSGWWSNLRTSLFILAIGLCFVALPGTIVLLTSPKSPGLTLGEYIACDSVYLWRKATAILP